MWVLETLEMRLIKILYMCVAYNMSMFCGMVVWYTSCHTPRQKHTW